MSGWLNRLLDYLSPPPITFEDIVADLVASGEIGPRDPEMILQKWIDDGSR